MVSNYNLEIRGKAFISDSDFLQEVQKAITNTMEAISPKSDDESQITWKTENNKKGIIESGEILGFVISFGTGVAAGVFANYLTKNLKHSEQLGEIRIEKVGKKTVFHAKGSRILIEENKISINDSDADS